MFRCRRITDVVTRRRYDYAALSPARARSPYRLTRHCADRRQPGAISLPGWPGCYAQAVMIAIFMAGARAAGQFVVSMTSFGRRRVDVAQRRPPHHDGASIRSFSFIREDVRRAEQSILR